MYVNTIQNITYNYVTFVHSTLTDTLIVTGSCLYSRFTLFKQTYIIYVLNRFVLCNIVPLTEHIKLVNFSLVFGSF
jgi:hypothetical protein